MTPSPVSKLCLSSNVILSSVVLTAVPSALKFATILPLTRLDSRTAPTPLPPSTVIFGFSWYPMPGDTSLTSLNDPTTFAWPKAPDPCWSLMISGGPVITSNPEPGFVTVTLVRSPWNICSSKTVGGNSSTPFAISPTGLLLTSLLFGSSNSSLSFTKGYFLSIFWFLSVLFSQPDL